MASNMLKTKIQLRHDTAANWEASNPVLLAAKYSGQGSAAKGTASSGSTKGNLRR